MSNQSKENKIKELEHEVAKLRGYLRTDTLTQTLNRKGLHDQLASVFDEVIYTRKHLGKRRKMEIEDLSVVFIDLDDFKQINDTYGHDTGDTVLQTVGAFLLRSVRGIDHVARYGGEEFVVLLANTDTKDALGIAERLRKEVIELKIPHRKSKTSDHVTISLGVATSVPERDSSPDSIVAEADQALYKAKSAGRNRVQT